VIHCSFLIKYSIRSPETFSLPPYLKMLLGSRVGSLTNPAANPSLGHLHYQILLEQNQIIRIKVDPHLKHS
jgi:hypothetical protein